MTEQRTTGLSTVETMMNLCKQGHEWHSTIIGYFQCSRYLALAACHLCVSKVRGHPLVGVCQQHRGAGTPKADQEALA